MGGLRCCQCSNALSGNCFSARNDFLDIGDRRPRIKRGEVGMMRRLQEIDTVARLGNVTPRPLG